MTSRTLRPSTDNVKPDSVGGGDVNASVLPVRRVVVKVGSAVIAGKGRLRPKIIAMLAHDVAVCRRKGVDVVLVVSGAVAAGFRGLGLTSPPSGVVERQAAASIGQPRLMARIAEEFASHRTPVAQLLLSAEDIENRRRFLSARHTLQSLLANGVVPVLNENDALSDDERQVGDNDHLAALVTSLVSADLLVILSKVPGLLAGGNGQVVPRVDFDDDAGTHVDGTRTDTGVGGMGAKISAARIAGRWNVPTVIAEGTKAGTLPEILAGSSVGTLFVPRGHVLSARKKWIAVRSRSRGVLVVDDGARRAMVERGASLLPVGIRAVEGEFAIGSRVDLRTEGQPPFGVGLVSYSADEIRKIQGRKVSEIEPALGYVYVDEVVQRDDLVLYRDKEGVSE
ncbi:MAG: glutamate 5-kinase [Candidatus Eisenbacteria bacterium]|uniref:Glutamate 5-kinase n=1 Tax=Eiseniibacteriota bacterium TaxID=2212470 RepID=A0A956SFR5_UNCEI|nr:glutamate 5-kinase [Candidatus Eisenbacteria bacterium]